MRSILLCSIVCLVVGLGCNRDPFGGDNPDGGDGGTMNPPGGDMRGRIDPEMACGSVRAQATLVKKPVDIIFVIDNSGSMTLEIQSVQSNINQNFAQIIQNSGLDYRIIMLSKHGSAVNDQSVCIQAPLAGNASCSPIPAQPSNTNTFKHYSFEISSTNSLSAITSRYAVADEFNLAPTGWREWLRPGTFKTFVEVTDDQASISAATFETNLFALDTTNKPFGDATNRNYKFHSIVGVVEKATRTDPYQPTEPVVTTACSSAVNTGSRYQDLARLTGGLRYPVCETANYDSVFQAVAQGVISGSQISCDFDVPPPPPMREYVLETAQLEYFPGGGGPSKILTQVPNSGACTSDSFYISNNHVYLCGTTCTEVQATPGARIEFLLECTYIVG